MQLPHGNEEVPSPSTESGSVQEKKMKFDDWAEDFPTELDEVGKYLQGGFSNNDNVLQWWKQNSDKFPRLACVAKQVLNIPATSASSERVFSCSGYLIGAKRSNIDAQRLNDLVVIHENI